MTTFLDRLRVTHLPEDVKALMREEFAQNAAATDVTAHAALRTGVHGLAITSGKTLTVQNDVTITGALGSAAYANTNAFVAARSFGTAAAANVGDFATSAQGGKADSALQAVTWPMVVALLDALPTSDPADGSYWLNSGVLTKSVIPPPP